MGAASLLAGLVILSRGHARLGGAALGMDVLALAGLWIFALAIHEGGHVVAAVAQRLPIRSVRIACFVLARRSPDGPFAFSLVRWQGGGTTVVDARAKARATQMLVFLLGGCAFNLLAAVGALLLHRYGAGPTGQAVAVLNAAMLAVNLLPGTGPAPGDGTMIVRTLRAASRRSREARREGRAPSAPGAS
jgi:hypothetical protein